MVSEILLREALQALSIPLTEATVRSSRKIAAHEVDKLTNYYRRLVTDEFILHTLNPQLNAPDPGTVDLVAQAQAILTYQDILRLAISPEAALDIQYNRARHLRARKKVHLSLGAHPTSTEVEGAFLLAQGDIPPADTPQSPREQLEAEIDLNPTPLMEHLIPQLIRLAKLRHGDTLPDSVTGTYEWAFACLKKQ